MEKSKFPWKKGNKFNFRSKCHVLHIGKNECKTPDLFVENEKMSLKNDVKYLGDLISSNGSNDKNIDARFNKGLGISAQVNAMTNQIALGSHHFKIGLLLRNTNLINGILFNSEVWYGLRKKDIAKLEKVDEIFLRNLLNAHSKTSIEALYTENNST